MHEQAVEIALGPKGAFENGSVGTLTRHVTADRVLNAATNARRPAKPPRQPRTPKVVELLVTAQEWRRQLDAGEVRTQAEIARREGITRARVTQIMGMLRLAPEIQCRILLMPASRDRLRLSEHALRSVAGLDTAQQLATIESILHGP